MTNDMEDLMSYHELLFLPRHDMLVGAFDRKDTYVCRQWPQIQHLADLFWERWSNSYATRNGNDGFIRTRTLL
jgi:hypothetical protein